MTDQALKPAEDLLYQFIQQTNQSRWSWPRNTWICTETINVYVRKGTHTLDQMRTCLDIASVEVPPELQRQGIFSRFIAKAHEMNPWEATYLENVHNPVLRNWCVRHGWAVADPPLNYYKLKDRNMTTKDTKALHQVCEATKPTPSLEKTKCAIYGCNNPPELVLRLGGGRDHRTSTQSTAVLCRSHSFDLRDSINTILHEGDDRLAKCQICHHWDWKTNLYEDKRHNPDGPDLVVYYCGNCNDD